MTLFNSAIAAVIERIIAQFAGQHSQFDSALIPLRGKSISIVIQDFNQCFTLVFEEKVNVLAQQNEQDRSVADCYLSISLAAAQDLMKDTSQLTQLIKEEKLILQGDIQLVHHFILLIEHIRPDLEEQISHVIGDVAAHSLVHRAKTTLGWGRERLKKHQQHVSKAVTQEWKLVPSVYELASFHEQIQAVAAATQQLEGRLAQCEHMLQQSAKGTDSC